MHDLRRGCCFAWLAATWAILFAFCTERSPAADSDAAKAEHSAYVVNRDMIQRLTQTQQLIQRDDYVSAVAALQSILDSTVDSFVQIDEGRYQSVRVSAERVLATLPDAGKRAYDLQYGKIAQHLLEKAERMHSVDGMTDVARRFFQTNAGLRATYRLGVRALDRGEPLLAARLFDRLRQRPEASRRFEPRLSVYAAICWARAGVESKAKRCLSEFLRRRTTNRAVQLAGRPIPEFESETAAWRWLNALSQAEASVVTRDAWLMANGNSCRNISASEANLVGECLWRRSTIRDDLDAALDPWGEIARDVERMRDRDDADPMGGRRLPIAQPLIVNDLVIYRSLGSVRAVRRSTGQTVWEAVIQSALLEQLYQQRVLSSLQSERPGWPAWNQVLRERLWEDGVSTTLSSDGRRVFVLETERAASSPTRRGLPMRPDESPEPIANRLLAIDVANGKLLWEAGGPHGEIELPIAGTQFLGVPLPLDSGLYCLAEIGGEVRLLELESGTGALLWSQPLITPAVDLSVDVHRRLSGIQIAHQDGILICSTGAGYVVAVDVTRRVLLWCYRYESNTPVLSPAQRDLLAMWAVHSRGMPEPNWNDWSTDSNWLVSPPLIGAGAVLLTPSDSDELHCLDLLDGSLSWKRTRNRDLYVAGIHDDSLLLVGQSDVRSLGLSDGVERWSSPTPIATPAGRGFRVGNRYHIPLTTGEIATVDWGSGRILAKSRSRLGTALGNLSVANGAVVSASIDSLATLESAAMMRKQIADRLNVNPDDTAALSWRGLTRLHQGDTQRGLNDLKHVLELDSDAPIRDEVVTTLLEGLRFDFPNYRDNTEQIRHLAKNPSQLADLHRWNAVGLKKTGEYQAALEECLELGEQLADNAYIKSPGGRRTVRRDRWVAAQIADLFHLADQPNRDRMDAIVVQHLQQRVDQDDPIALQRLLNCLITHSIADEARGVLIDRLTEVSDLPQRRWHLQRLLNSPNQLAAAFAAARLVPDLLRHGRPDVAFPLANRLESSWADIECQGKKTGRDLVRQWRSDADLAPGLKPPRPWPTEAVQTTTVLIHPHRSNPSVVTLPIEGRRSPWFNGWSLTLDDAKQQLVGRDPDGVDRWRLSIPDDLTLQNSVVMGGDGYQSISARIRGHLLLVVLRDQFAVVDLFDDTVHPKVLWKRSLISPPRPRTISMPRQVFGFGGFRAMPAPMMAGQGTTVRLMIPSLGTIEAMTTDFICYQIGDQLRVVDVLTGELLWARDDVPPGCRILADEDVVISIRPDNQQAVVLNASDGSERTHCLPATGTVLATWGRHLVLWQQDELWRLVTSIDLATGQTKWQHQFAADSRPTVIDDEIAVMEPNGHLKIFSIDDGAIQLDVRVPLKTDDDTARPIDRLNVLRSNSQYTVFVTQPRETDADRERVLIAGVPRHIIVDGPVFAFSRGTGELLWSERLDQQILNPYQPQELPVLIFASRRYAQTVDPNGLHRRQIVSDVLVLDRRNGKKLCERRFEGRFVSTCEIQANRRAGRIDIDFSPMTVTVTYASPKETGKEPPTSD